MKKVFAIISLLLFAVILVSCDKVIQEVGQKTVDPAAQEQESGEQPQEPEAGQQPGEPAPEDQQPQTGNEQDDTTYSFDDDSGYQFITEGVPSTMPASAAGQVKSANAFAFSLLRNIDSYKKKDSYVFSPTGLTYLLGMLIQGAGEQTRKELCEALGFGDLGADGVNEFCRNLMVLSSSATKAGENLSISNIAVVDKGISVLEDYRKSIKNYYDALTASLDFEKPGYVVGYVNAWASEKTNGRIKHVLSSLPPYTRCLIMNALYFSASWTSGFNESATTSSSFTGADGKVRSEMMMHKSDAYVPVLYAEDQECSVVCLPYGKDEVDGNFEMYIMLPAKGVDIQKTAGRTADEWNALFAKMKKRAVDLAIPRFTVEFGEDLSGILENMGINAAFDEQKADFSNMSRDFFSVSTIKQVANITVDEKGTEAAALSLAMMDIAGGEEPEFIPFHADRPFLFAIKEKTTGTILFLGSYK